MCLLVLLTVSYSAAKGSARLWHDALVGLVWWVGIMAALAFLMMLPDALIWVIRLGLVIAALYALRVIWRGLYHLWIHVPATQYARRRQIMQACSLFDEDRRVVAQEAATAMLSGYTVRIVLAAVVEALRFRDGGMKAEKMMDFIAGECDRATVLLQGLTPALAHTSPHARQLERGFLEELVLFFGRGSVEPALKEAQKEEDTVRVRHIARAAAMRGDPGRAEILRALGFDVPVVGSGEEAFASTRDLLFWIIAFIHPFWVYFYFRGTQTQALVWFLMTGLFGFGLCLWAYLRAGQVKRALVFGITAAVVGGYGVYARFVVPQSSGWVFAAVFGLIYITALLNLGPTFERRPHASAEADTGRA